MQTTLKSSSNLDATAQVALAGFRTLFTQRTPAEVVEEDALLLSARFLQEVEELMKARNITRRALATQVGTSASFITQLFRGDRLLSLTMAAKLEAALGIRFHVRAVTSEQARKGASVEVVPGISHLTASLTPDPHLPRQLEASPVGPLKGGLDAAAWQRLAQTTAKTGGMHQPLEGYHQWSQHSAVNPSSRAPLV